MPKVAGSTCAVLSLGAVVAGCQTAPVRYADQGVHATYQVAATGASAVRTTGAELYTGAGRAVRQPFHDLNMMQDKIAPVLLRAESHPYDLAGVNSCNDVLNRVAELDLALGPDVDTPKERKKRSRSGADFAASAALDAAGSAAEHFIPMRGTIKQLTGATRYENHVKHATLAGATRRSFLKAIGMAHNCSWPAAPLDFTPVQVADVNAPWTGPGASQASVMLAATPPASAPRGLGAQAPVAVATRDATPAGSKLGPAQPRIVVISAADAGRPGAPVFVPVHDQLAIPNAEPPVVVAGQSWRPAGAAVVRANIVPVSAPVTTTAALGASQGDSGSAAPPPWASGFAGSSARP